MVKVEPLRTVAEVKETLDRIGVPSTRYGSNRLYPSCVVYEQDDKVYIAHFKEMLEAEGKTVEYQEDDIVRRNNILNMMQNWGLIDIMTPDIPLFKDGIKVKIVKHAEKKDWIIVKKYNVKASKSNLTVLEK